MKSPALWWVLGIVLLCLLALASYFLVVPYYRARAAVELVSAAGYGTKDARSKLGSAPEAVADLKYYLWLNGPHRKGAIVLLGECGGEGVPVLKALLRSSRDADQSSALIALRIIGPDGHDAAGDIADLMRKEHGDRLLEAIRTHLAVTGGNTKTVEGIVRAAKGQEVIAQLEAVFLFPRLTHVVAVKEMCVQIEELYPGLSGNARIEAARSLWRITRRGARSNAILRNYIQDTDDTLVTRACLVALDMGIAARALEAECVAVVRADDRPFAPKRAAMLALAAMDADSPAVTAALESTVQGKDRFLAKIAARSLARIKKTQEEKEEKSEPEKQPAEPPAK